MTELAPAAAPATPESPSPATTASRLLSWIPTWGLITTKNLELRKRRGLMIAVGVLTIGLPVVVLGIRLLYQVIDPKASGPAGSPAVFTLVVGLMAEFGFIVAAVLGATAGTTDLTDGMFRHLASTGRSRLALYFARLPASLAILVPLIAVAYTMVCLVTAYEGTPPAKSVTINGLAFPEHLDQSQLLRWAEQRPLPIVQQAFPRNFGPIGPRTSLAHVRSEIASQIGTVYHEYAGEEELELGLPPVEMAKIGLWLELAAGTGLIVGLGLGSLMGQRTVPIVLLIVLEIIVTPIFAQHAIPDFLDGQRLFVGVAIDQLRPASLGVSAVNGGILSGANGIQIPAMPTWAMISVIVGWLVGWTGIGAWRMSTRDA
jgi:hypothetical protein